MSADTRMRIGQIPLSDNYRQAVGPEDMYDLISAHQFCVLINEGLREWHKMLDIGCGSLRGGRLFIPYLQPGNYYGIEPNEDLVRDGIALEIGNDIYRVKSPTFYYSDQFDFSMHQWCNTSSTIMFDFILAQSIFSHSTQSQAKQCISEAARVLTSGGKLLATFVKGSCNSENREWSRPIVYRTSSFFQSLAREHNLVYTELNNIAHPCNQTWFRMERKY